MFWGRIVGAMFGLLIAGPVGALIGLFVGATFDRGYVHQHRAQFEHQRFVQQTYFKIAFQVMGHIAKSDGRVSEDEIYSARQIMRRMHLNDDQIIQAIHFFNQGKDSAFDFDAALTELYSACHTHPVLLQMFVEMQFQAVTAGKIDAAKQRLLDAMCDQLGTAPLFYGRRSQYRGERQQSQGQRSQGQHSQYRAPREPKRTLADDYRLLNVAANASDAELKKAYRKLMSQNHPDKLVSQGLPEQMIKLATEKTQKIIAAYERIMQSRGK